MTHPNTQHFIADWSERRGARRLPNRADLAPAVFGRLVPQLFMLGVAVDGRSVFRLAGGLLADLHGRELHGASFAGLWREAERPAIARALDSARRNASPLVLQAAAYPETGEPIGLEIALAPVLNANGRAERLFGLYQPTSLVARLRGGPVRQLALRSVVSPIEQGRSPGPRLVALDGRRVA